MAVIRTWICENARCSERFDSWEANPECPKCHCVRVSWCPAGGHIGGAAKAADADLRALADHFSLLDMNSGERGRQAKKVNLPPPPDRHSGPVHTFGPGFSAVVNPAAGAQCVPTANKVDYKIKATPGNALAPSAVFPSVRANTAVEATHKP